MLLGTKAVGANRFEHHLIARALKGKKFKKAIVATLMLTAMVDMFSVLVIFLLQTFSASPEMLVTKGVTLPAARTGAEITDAPVLALSENEVYLDQKLVGKTKELLLNPTPLAKELRGLKKKWDQTYPDKPFSGEINIQADQKVPSTIVSQFMGILPGQYFTSIQLAVVAGGRAVQPKRGANEPN